MELAPLWTALTICFFLSIKIGCLAACLYKSRLIDKSFFELKFIENITNKKGNQVEERFIIKQCSHNPFIAIWKSLVFYSIWTFLPCGHLVSPSLNICNCELKNFNSFIPCMYFPLWMPCHQQEVEISFLWFSSTRFDFGFLRSDFLY